MIKPWIPNVLSLGNLSLGFMAILTLFNNGIFTRFDTDTTFFIAGVLILTAVILDGADGAVARWLKVESPLGKNLDTLADLTTFGLAPGILMYNTYLYDLFINITYFSIPVGIIVATAYPVSAAFRLARFNVSSSPNSFTGLPSPIAGALVALSGVTYHIIHINSNVAAILFFTLSFLMVSNIRYSKPQSVLREHFTTFRIIIFFLILIGLMLKFGWYWIVLSTLVIYVSSGLIVLVIHALQKIKVVLGR